MANTEKLLPVTLPSWPGCDRCLSWSEDDLAVAGGEFVHIITPRTQSSSSHTRTIGHPQWHLTSFRVNLFEQDEWPEQTTATITDLSIGEEQSLSHVVALAWSNSGLGVHRRPVLAVLTSNLVLSIWERSGGPTHYTRTCVINKYSGPASTTIGKRPDRRARRIRSFAWLPPIKDIAKYKWGLHYLLVVDDHEQAMIFQISKHQSGRLGRWNLEVLLKLSLADIDPKGPELEVMSPLQRRMHLQCPITRVVAGPWIYEETQLNENVGEEENSGSSMKKASSKVIFTKGKLKHAKVILALISNGGEHVSFSIVTESQSVLDSRGDPADLLLTGASNESTEAQVINSPELYFKRASQPLSDDFDHNFRLFGHFRIQFWGSALSIDGSQAVACITIHPSDMIEHTIPSTQKCILIFENTGLTESGKSSTIRSDRSVQEDIVHVACGILKEQASLESPLDQKLFRVYRCLADILFSHDSELKTSLRDLHTSLQMDKAAEPTDQTSANTRLDESHDRVPEYPEECEICDARIAFTADTTSGYCGHGHQFSRCQLSFLAIQEPGISKYCSQCGKQFLDFVKLGSISGPSFAQSMFEEYDVCPYCQGKFRE